MLRVKQISCIRIAPKKINNKRPKLENEYVKNEKKEKRIFAVVIYKEREKYYELLDLKNVTDNIQFWKTVQPFDPLKLQNFIGSFQSKQCS